MVAVSVAVQTDRRPGDYARVGAQAEALGFDGVSAFHDLGFQQSLPALLEVAGATSRVRVGVACLNPFLTHPVEIAGQAAALQLASAGRAYVGIARGAWLDRVGVVQQRPLTRMREAVEVVRRVLSGDDSGFTGEVFSLAPGMRLEQPPGPVPILIGTWGPRGLALAAELADEVKLGGTASPDMVRLARERLDAAGGAHVGLVAGAVTVADRDGGAARARARRAAAMYLEVVARLDETVVLPDDGSLPDELLRRFTLAGTPGEVAEHAAELVAAGATRIEFGAPHGLDSPTGIELLGTHVLPALRELP